MKHLLIAAALVAAALPPAAAAQELPFRYGDFWEITEVEVQDGAGLTYLEHLAAQWKKNQDFARSKGWIKEYHVLSNLNKRAGEPDMYLVAVFTDMPNAREAEARDKAYDAFTKRTIRREQEASGQRASYRKITGSRLLGEVVFK